MASGLYKLGGLDVYTTYGWIIEEGSNPILQQRKAKPRFSNDWPEHNGKEYDLSAPKFEDRIFNIKGTILASNESDFHTKYNALFTALNVSGTVTLQSLELNKTVNVIYLDMTSLDRLTPIKNNNRILVRFTLSLQEVQDV